ncbi:ATP-binding protein [Streptomyces vinaceus]|uniref:ATP-binding protein n=1 Tax=Streptomyces vinaceus TaxID=1960 RepID=UPI0035D96AE0
MSTITHQTAAAIRPAHGEKAVREARRLASEALEECRHAHCENVSLRADDVLLVISELVTNACRHAGGASEVRVQWQQGELMVEVEDASDALPQEPTEDAKGEAGGYGCQLVTALADRWGVAPRRGLRTTPGQTCGKTVYACFAIA